MLLDCREKVIRLVKPTAGSESKMCSYFGFAGLSCRNVLEFSFNVIDFSPNFASPISIKQQSLHTTATNHVARTTLLKVLNSVFVL